MCVVRCVVVDIIADATHKTGMAFHPVRYWVFVTGYMQGWTRIRLAALVSALEIMRRIFFDRASALEISVARKSAQSALTLLLATYPVAFYDCFAEDCRCARFFLFHTVQKIRFAVNCLFQVYKAVGARYISAFYFFFQGLEAVIVRHRQGGNGGALRAGTRRAGPREILSRSWK